MEFNKPQYGMLRAEYQGSFFKNNFMSLEWDNPLRATDYDNGKLPPAGPWDASGYSNGNGPAFGRDGHGAQQPDEHVPRLRPLPDAGTHDAERQLAFTKMTQNEDILPFTTNTKIAQAATYPFFPAWRRCRAARRSVG